jgi:hypothetical protein
MSTMKRRYGTGNLRIRRGSWYGQWWIGDRRIQRKLGPVRQPGTREGLTRKMAEVELRRVMAATNPAPSTDEVTFTDAAAEFLRYAGEIRQIDAKTLSDYSWAGRGRASTLWACQRCRR